MWKRWLVHHLGGGALNRALSDAPRQRCPVVAPTAISGGRGESPGAGRAELPVHPDACVAHEGAATKTGNERPLVRMVRAPASFRGGLSRTCGHLPPPLKPTIQEVRPH